MVFETLVSTKLNHLTRLIARENFIIIFFLLWIFNEIQGKVICDTVFTTELYVHLNGKFLYLLFGNVKVKVKLSLCF
jgi:hypothetical protein